MIIINIIKSFTNDCTLNNRDLSQDLGHIYWDQPNCFCTDSQIRVGGGVGLTDIEAEDDEYAESLRDKELMEQ